MKHKTRIIIAGSLGNLVESFDMAICGLMSVYLSQYLIQDSKGGVLALFLTFFIAYLVRPIGAVTMGILSDKHGRKTILAASILIMGIATALIGFIPDSSYIGKASLYILFLFRIIQSFSCGAEYLNSSAYLIENADEGNKGYSGSWASFGAMAGLTLASIVTLSVSYCINKYPDLSWLIWRLPFVLALLGSSIGLYVRLCVPESMEYIRYYSEQQKPKYAWLFKQSLVYINNNKKTCLYSFLLSSIGVMTTFQIYIYSPMQAHVSGRLIDNHIMLTNILSLLVLLGIFPFLGKLSDKINREKIIITACLGFLILYQPFFYYLSQGSFYQLLISQILITIPAAAYYSIVPVMLAEMFPLNLRCTIVSIIYSTAASLSAGLAPLLSYLLFNNTGYSTSPSIIIFVLIIPLFITINFIQQYPNNNYKYKNT